MIFFDQLFGVDAIFRFPRVVAVGISFPLKEVLQLPLSSLVSVIEDGFYFVFVFSPDQLGWRSDKVGPV
jgi:hypothetical protein